MLLMHLTGLEEEEALQRAAVAACVIGTNPSALTDLPFLSGDDDSPGGPRSPLERGVALPPRPLRR